MSGEKYMDITAESVKSILKKEGLEKKYIALFEGI